MSETACAAREYKYNDLVIALCVCRLSSYCCPSTEDGSFCAAPALFWTRSIEEFSDDDDWTLDAILS
jgi:hypothetical protein